MQKDTKQQKQGQFLLQGKRFNTMYEVIAYSVEQSLINLSKTL